MALKNHPDRNPGDADGRGAIQGSGRGVRDPLRPAEAGSATTAMAMPGVEGGRAPRLPQRRRHHVGVQRHLRRRDVRRHLPAASKRGPRPGQDLLMKVEIELLEAARGRGQGRRGHPPGAVRRLQGVGGPQGDRGDDLQLLRGAGAGCPVAGVLPGRDHLPGLRRRRRADQRPLPELPGGWARPRAWPTSRSTSPRGSRPGCGSSSGTKGRPATPGAPQGEPPGPGPDQAASVLRAEPQRPHHPGADQLLAGCARGRDRGADARRADAPDAVPKGTQSGDVLKLKGRGMPDINGRGRGTSWSRSTSRPPGALTRPATRSCLRELAELEHLNVQPQAKKLLREAPRLFHRGRGKPSRGRPVEALRRLTPAEARIEVP